MTSIRISSSGSTDGRPGAVEWCQVWPNRAEVDEAVDRSQQMVGRHMLLE
jgi:hypothetical protein